MSIMLIQNIIIDNIHYIDFITFTIDTFIFLDFCPVQIGVRLIHSCVLYAIKYGT